MICLLFAMDKECAALLDHVEVLDQSSFGFTKVTRAKYQGKEFLMAVSGIGKGFASAAVAAVACRFPEVRAFYNVGVAGSLNKDRADIFSCVIGESYVEHDLDTSAIGDPKGLVSGINIVHLPSDKKCIDVLQKACQELGVPSCLGVISSGDTFYPSSQKARKKEIVDLYGSLSLDMESAPFAQIAYCYGIPFASARVISDATNPEVEYPANVTKASAIASDIALKTVLLGD